MLEAVATRIQAARTRLHAAVMSGQDSAHHRSAIAALQRDFEATRARIQSDLAAAETRRAEEIQRCARLIEQQAHQRIAASIPTIPTCPQ